MTDPFLELIGQLAWSIKQTHGSCFLMEFGGPHLRVRERQPQQVTGIPTAHERRRVTLFGDCSLLVLDCNWTFSVDCHFVNQDTSLDKMRNAFSAFEGQYLSSATFDGDTNSYTLQFDLSGSLKLSSKDGSNPFDDQWQLHFIDERVISLQNNGGFTIEGTEP
jgi:hypothetical protein